MKRIVGKINPEDRQVHIWGAGFSGLVLGYYLKDQGYKVTIYERSSRAGGKIQTVKTNSGLAEKGANALYLNQDGLDLLRDLQLEPVPARKKLRRLLLLNGKPRQPLQLKLFSKVAVNLYKKPPLISEGLTVADFFEPLIGKHNIDQYISPVLGGLYASPAESLHFKSIFPIGSRPQFPSYWEFFKTLIKYHKSQPKPELTGSVSFEGGMQTLIDRLSEVLRHNIKLNYKEPFKIRGNTIICTDAHAASELLQQVRPEMSRDLSRINYRQLSTATVFLKREIRSLNKAFGVLLPSDTGYSSLGIVNNRAIFPVNNQNVTAYTLIGSKNVNREDVIADLRQLSPDLTEEAFEDMEITFWEKALPVYDLQLYLAIKRLHQLGRKETNLAIFGNYVAGISLREMITAAKSFSRYPTDYTEIP